MNCTLYRRIKMTPKDYLKYINHRFTVRLFENQFPNEYRCSKCSDGVLTFLPEEFHKHETIESIREKNDECWEPEWIEYIFSGSLICQNCSEHYFVTGTGTVEEQWDQEEGAIHYDVYYPKFFIPTINVFKIPVNTPKEISEIITSSFAIAWCDFSGSGNKLRVALELIVSELVPNSDQTLGNKINAISSDKSDIREMIKAIKWLGNQGSHEAKLEEYDLAFAFKITEKVLTSLYPDKDENETLMKHVQMVNAVKGSIAKK